MLRIYVVYAVILNSRGMTWSLQLLIMFCTMAGLDSWQGPEFSLCHHMQIGSWRTEEFLDEVIRD